MRDQTYDTSLDFLKTLFGDAEGRVELRACPNERGAFAAQSIFTRDEAEIVSFCQRQDREGAAVYFGVATRRPGVTSGNKSTVLEAPALWVDIDCAKQGLKGEDTLAALEFLPFPPSTIVNSGGGFHAYWLLEEPADVSAPELYEPIEALCRRLALILAGDTSCAEIARILRLPGTMNSKPATLKLNDGAPFVAEIMAQTGRVYGIEQLAEWLADQRAILHGKAKSEIKAVREDDPFTAYAVANGYNPRIDIDAELAAMKYGAEGDRSIHRTQIRVAYSMIARGHKDDEIVDLLLRATEAAAPADANWNWAREEREIRKDVVRSRKKQEAQPPSRASKSAPPVTGNLAVVHNIKEEREKREKPKAAEDVRQTQIVAIGKAVIGVWNDRHGPIMHTGGTTYCYEGGIWHPWNDALAQRLRTMIQEACESLQINPTTSILNAAKVYVMDRPSLHREGVEFDRHGLLVANDCALDLKTMAITPHSPEHYALFKVAADLQGERACPAWKDFLAQAWADRSCCSEIISTLQEWFGASIAVTRARPMLKGLLVHGPSRSGKTQVSKVMRALLGERFICNARMRDLEGRFGMEPLIGKRGWIADDAIGAKEYLDAETYKVVVTGEDTSAQMKGGKNWEGRFGFPVMLTANNLPRVNDKSDATYNRSLILPMTVVRPETAPEPPGYESIAQKIIAEELTGVLWWAIEGRQRLMARGQFSPPTAMTEAGRSFQDSNDPIGSWLRQCVEPSATFKVARKDLSTSFNGWWELESDDGKPFSSNSITREIKARFASLTEVKVRGERMLAGIKLNEEGLFAWESRVKSGHFSDRSPAYSASRDEVNRIHSSEPEVPPEERKNIGKPRF